MGNRPEHLVGYVNLPPGQVVRDRTALVVSREVAKVDSSKRPSRIARQNTVGNIPEMEPIGVRVGTNRFDRPPNRRGVGFRAAKVRIAYGVELNNVGSIAEVNAVSE